MTTLLVTHEACFGHDPGRGHPESPARLKAVLSALEAPAFAGLERRIAPLAEIEQIARVHARPYVDRVLQAIPSSGYVGFDPDTIASPGSGEAALRAAGAVTAAVDAVVAGEARNAFCAVRPPGHHAEAGRAMGFCLFNNVAIAARYAQNRYGLQRILIVDWDVHHGNGTQHSFEDDPSVLFFSTHQFPHYPGTGRGTERGTGAGEGFTINVPMKAGGGDEDYQAVFHKPLVPAADTYKPDFVMISAGFDAHKDDPLASMELTDAGYAELTAIVAGIAKRYAHARILSTLEGGYNLTALAASVDSHLTALLNA